MDPLSLDGAPGGSPGPGGSCPGGFGGGPRGSGGTPWFADSISNAPSPARFSDAAPSPSAYSAYSGAASPGPGVAAFGGMSLGGTRSTREGEGGDDGGRQEEGSMEVDG